MGLGFVTLRPTCRDCGGDDRRCGWNHRGRSALDAGVVGVARAAGAGRKEVRLITKKIPSHYTMCFSAWVELLA